MLLFQLDDSRAAIAFELESLDMRPDPEPLLVELIHAVSVNRQCLCHIVSLPFSHSYFSSVFEKFLRRMSKQYVPRHLVWSFHSLFEYISI